jgi:hypothetical protein
MGLSRKDALKKMNGLKKRIEQHIKKVAETPASRDVPHWLGEIRSWIAQVEEASEHVGARTQDEWQRTIESWKAGLGEGDGSEEEA